MNRGLFFAVCLAIGACSPWSATEPGPRTGRPKSLLSAEARNTTRLTRRWLVGYWTVGDCRSDAGTSLWSDGTYNMGDGYGRWSLSGNTLTTEEVRGPTTYIFAARLGMGIPFRIWIAGPNTIRVQGVGPPDSVAPTIFPMHRCE